MTSRLAEPAIDCADPRALARFWCTVLYHEARRRRRRHDRPPPSGGPMPTFAAVPEVKSGKNQLHVDASPADR